MRYKKGTKTKYKNSVATVVDSWYDGVTWRYEVYIERGKNKGVWTTTEDYLKPKR